MRESGEFVGIDVSKARLDIASRSDGRSWSAPNDAAGIADLVRELQDIRALLVVLEATGGIKRRIVSALDEAGIPVAVVNPRQIRDFARAAESPKPTQLMRLFWRRMPKPCGHSQTAADRRCPRARRVGDPAS